MGAGVKLGTRFGELVMTTAELRKPAPPPSQSVVVNLWLMCIDYLARYTSINSPFFVGKNQRLFAIELDHGRTHLYRNLNVRGC